MSDISQVNNNTHNIIKAFGEPDYSEILETQYVNPIFPHNFLMNMYQGILRYIAKTLPRKPKYLMVTTYQKGIERLHKEYLDQNNGDINSQHFPALILQPQPIKIDERINSTWMQMSPMSESVVRSRYKPYAEIGDFKLWVVPNRFTTNFDIFYIGESYLEITDMYFHMNRIFNTRFKFIKNLSKSLIMIPDELVEKVEEQYGQNLFELSDDFTLSVKLAYNRKNYSVPYTNNIFMKLNDASDGSNYLGDTELPTYRVNFSFESMFQLPNHLVAGYEALPTSLALQMGFNAKDIVIDTGFLANNKEQATLIHIYDQYPSEFSIEYNRTRVPDNLFKEFYVQLTDIDTGIVTRLPDSNFTVISNPSSFDFKLSDVPNNKAIDIIGVYNKES